MSIAGDGKVDIGGSYAAFPHIAAEGHRDYRPGMTLRDWFAGRALSEIASDGSTDWLEKSANEIAKAAYAVADAMLKAREEPPHA